ncbi:YrdB family protein [Ureibacillus sp. Re31]|uniref:YrdB family protein n=1 Tax=Ureibacillus galli TaxID=2762222 RepID=A0ABR8X9P9_9BACL|nr:YrdB family protein [Ureibacillus galli]MBD8025912.1 YrdB family protein [Ureibacillus galli]
MKVFNGLIAFTVEVICIVIYARFGYYLFQEQLWKSGFAIVFPFTLMVVWGKFFAPKAQRRLQMPELLIGKMMIMFIAVGMLWIMNGTIEAIIFAVVVIFHLSIAVKIKEI